MWLVKYSEKECFFGENFYGERREEIRRRREEKKEKHNNLDTLETAGPAPVFK